VRAVNGYDYWNTGLFSLLGPGYLDLTADQVREACGSLAGDPPSFASHLGTFWLTATFNHTGYNHVGLPNDMIDDCSVDPASGGVGDSMSGMHGARSRHPGTVNVLFFDGSVRGVGASIDLELWRAYASMAGAEPSGE
jgi:prepilin-type processing-associated H-X9-DG protein